LKRFLISLIILGSGALALWLAKVMQISLYGSAGWAVFFAAALGIFLGGIAGFRSRRSNSRDRHTVYAFMEHWGTASGIFLMIFSGFQIYHGEYSLFHVNTHFVGLILSLVFGVQFVTDFVVSKKYLTLLPDGKDIVNGTLGKYLLRAKWQDAGKYLASQKAAFLAFLILGSEIVITGFIKMAVFYVSIPMDIMKMATQVHDISAVMFVLLLMVHIFFVVALKPHRKLFRSWFGGGAAIGIPQPASERQERGDTVPTAVETVKRLEPDSS
jgi:cytochrome b subunit of formate dehydrogenase